MVARAASRARRAESPEGTMVRLLVDLCLLDTDAEFPHPALYLSPETIRLRARALGTSLRRLERLRLQVSL